MDVLPDPEAVPTMKVDDAVPFLGISRASAYAAIKRGEIPSIRLGDRVLIPTAALRRFLGLDVG